MGHFLTPLSALALALTAAAPVALALDPGAAPMGAADARPDAVVYIQLGENEPPTDPKQARKEAKQTEKEARAAEKAAKKAAKAAR